MEAVRVVLLSTYEMGRQPFGVASAAAWLESAGATVSAQDLAVCELDLEPIRAAGMIGVFVPMHTATRLALALLPRLRRAHPDTTIACFGLYAAMNGDSLRAAGADVVIGGEFETALVETYLTTQAGERPAGERFDLARQAFEVPQRAGLPPLDRYARLESPDAAPRLTGYTEATRGCKHRCRHCPVVPVYEGRFVVVPPDVVLADVRAQVAVGAEHVTFGDPDFFNGPAHALRVVRALHDEFPALTYDVTIKVEHLRRHLDLLGELRATGCVLVTTAVESFDAGILARYDKGHDASDFAVVLAETRRLGLALNPTFVAFTPWTTRAGYLDFLATVAGHRLVGNVAPIQYGIRLLIPAGSLLLELPEVAAMVEPFDPGALVYPWRHPDPALDALCEEVVGIAGEAGDRVGAFAAVWRAARRLVDPADPRWPTRPPEDEARAPATVPYLTEPWYC